MLEGVAGSRAFATLSPDRHTSVAKKKKKSSNSGVLWERWGCLVPHSSLVESICDSLDRNMHRSVSQKVIFLGFWQCSSCSARGGADSSSTAGLLPFYGPHSSSPSVLTCLLVSPLCSCNCAGIQQNLLHLVNMSTLSAGAA